MHRLYENEEITVFWNAKHCRRAKICVNGCPEVFDIQRRPWIVLENDENEKIVDTVRKCPTGALKVIYNEGIRVEYDEAGHRSVAYDGEKQVGECDYMVDEAGWDIIHTETDPAYRGKGIAKRLVYVVLEQAEKQKVKIIPSCSYAKKVLDE